MGYEKEYEKARDLHSYLLPARRWLLKKQHLPMKEWPLFSDLGNTWVDERAEIGSGTVIFPGCKIMGQSKIGKRCVIWPDTVLLNFTAGDEVVLGRPILSDSSVGDGSVIGKNAELRRSKLGKKVRMVHFSYLGDCEAGEGSNIGAGTITANYDGKNKNKTVLGPRTFTGILTGIVAPNTLPEGFSTSAGSILPANLQEKIGEIPPYTLLIIVCNAKEYRKKPRKKVL